MLEKLKEYWFPVLIGVFFLCVTVYFAYDQNKGKLPGKSVNGQQVVFSVDDQNITADQQYEELSKVYYEDRIFTMFQTALLDSSVKTTDDLKEEIQTSYDNTVARYQQYYGYDASYLDNIAKTYYGYDNFYDYLFYTTKVQKLYGQYISEHAEEFYTAEFQENNKPRMVSYVVLSLDDPNNPTAEETAKVKAAQDAWASDQYSADNFAEFAKNFSEDGNASNGGSFGYIDANTKGIDEVFLNKALELNEGEVSDWTFSETFGYYLIKVDSVKFDDFKNETDFVASVLSANEGLGNKILWETAQSQNVKFADESIEKIVKDALQVESGD